MANMIAKFGAVKNSIVDEDLKKLTVLAENITARFLYNKDGKDKVKKVFAGTGIFEYIDEKYEKSSSETLNRMFTRGLLEKVYSGTEFEKVYGKLEFNEDTHLPTEATAKIIKNPNLIASRNFQEKFAIIYGTVISPAVQALSVGAYDDFVQYHYVGYGDSPVFPVASNEVFVVEEISEGNYRAAAQYAHDKLYTANPKDRGAEVSLSFYQLASGTVRWEDHILAIARGFVKYFNLLAIKGMTAYVDARIDAGDTAFFLTSWNDANHKALIKLLGAANDNTLISVYGDINAVDVIQPDASALGAADLLGSVGAEYLARGYLGQYKGANIFSLRNTLIPRTINGSEPLFGAPEDVLWYLNDGYKPLHAVFEGETLSVDLNRIQTADATMRLFLKTKMDMVYVPGSKIGAIKLPAETTGTTGE